MKTVMGLGLALCGILLGFYVGGWVFFIGGIAGLIDVVAGAVAGSGISGMAVAINIGKIMLASAAGWLSSVVLIIPGIAMLRK